MKYCLILRNQGELSGLKNKWMDLEGWLIIVLFKIQATVALILPSVTCKGGKQYISKIRQTFANLKWIEKFGGMKAHHLVDLTSDHSALLIAKSTIQHHTRAKRFHFEAMWTKNVECKAIMENSQGMDFELSTPEGVMANLSCCVAKLMN